MPYTSINQSNYKLTRPKFIQYHVTQRREPIKLLTNLSKIQHFITTEKSDTAIYLVLLCYGFPFSPSSEAWRPKNINGILINISLNQIYIKKLCTHLLGPWIFQQYNKIDLNILIYIHFCSIECDSIDSTTMRCTALQWRYE